ncbi:hypothetical protein, partial [Nonomuraea sp. NPDC050643]|uniref:hypothetical protein n=1 Tax=Nonomuraea sp. NPDC050643 TaxID=3155660 RepID=UPI0033E99761
MGRVVRAGTKGIVLRAVRVRSVGRSVIGTIGVRAVRAGSRVTVAHAVKVDSRVTAVPGAKGPSVGRTGIGTAAIVGRVVRVRSVGRSVIGTIAGRVVRAATVTGVKAATRRVARAGSKVTVARVARVDTKEIVVPVARAALRAIGVRVVRVGSRVTVVPVVRVGSGMTGVRAVKVVTPPVVRVAAVTKAEDRGGMTPEAGTIVLRVVRVRSVGRSVIGTIGVRAVRAGSRATVARVA